MHRQELVEGALRVLKAWTTGESPTEADVRLLRSHQRADEAELALDDLACAIVARECRRVTSEVESPDEMQRSA